MVRGDWSVRRPGLRRRRLGVRVRQRQLPRHRRHRRGRPGAAPRAARRRAGQDAGASRAASPGCSGMQSGDGGWGGVRRRQHPRARPQAALLRLRRGHRPAFGGRDRARARDARRRGCAPTPIARAAGCRWLLEAQEPDGSWFGRWGANYVYGTGAAVPALVAAGRAPPRAASAGGRLAGAAAEPRRRLGRGHALLRRPGAGSGRGDSTASQTAWALLALLAAGERRSAALSAASRGSARRSAPTAPGTSPSTPAPASPATSTSTTTSTVWSSRCMRSRPLRSAGGEHDAGAGPLLVMRAAAAIEAAALSRKATRRAACSARAWCAPAKGACAAARALALEGRAHGAAACVPEPRRLSSRRAARRATSSSRPSWRRGRRRARFGTAGVSALLAGRAAASPGAARPHRPDLLASITSPAPNERAALAEQGVLAVDMESALARRRGRRTAVGRAARGCRHAGRTCSIRARSPAGLRALRGAPARRCRRSPTGPRAVGAAARCCWPGRVRSAPASSARSRSSSGRWSGSGAPVYVRKQIVHNTHVVADAGEPRRGVRGRARRGARRRHCGVLRARRVAGGPRRGGRGAGSR